MPRELDSFARLLIGLLAFGTGSGFSAPTTDHPAPGLVSQASARAPASTFTNRQVIETWGWIIAHDKNAAGIEISPAELDAFSQGFAANARGQPAPYDLDKIYWDIETLVKTRQEKAVRAVERKNEAVAKGFFADLKKNTNLFDLSDGVRYEILKPGNGPRPKPQQTVNVHYTGRLTDGSEFAQMGPVDMVLVTNRNVCRGWSEAIQKLNVGGTLRLYVPPPLAGADAALFGVQPGSAMVFDVELLSVRDTAPQDLADSLTPLPPPPPPPAPSGFTDRQIIETWGWTTAAETRVARFGLSEAELAALLIGLTDGIKDRPAHEDLKKFQPQVEQFVNDRLEKARQEFKQKQLADMEKLFAGLKTDTNVVELPDGLRYEILQPGRGPFPKPEQTVKVNYTGRLLNGRVFDSTAFGPLDIDLDKVIPGWTEGVQKINVGGKIKLYIPPSLGYGDEATSGIPPDSTLIFEIELLEIKNAPSTNPAATPTDR
jgi:FKBP-type peptidyl-prolyl cis-trans isomerase